MVAAVFIAGTLLIFWGLKNIVSAVLSQPVWKPPIHLVALLPLGLILALHIYLHFTQAAGGIGAMEIPLKVHYEVHILLPVLAWIILFASSTLAISSPSSRRLVGSILLVTLLAEASVAGLEIVQNRTGWRANPIAWVAHISIGQQTVKEMIFGTIGNPNWVAGYLAIALLPVLGWTVGCRKNLLRLIGLIAIILALVVIVSTRSKGAVVSLSVGLIHLGIVLTLWYRGKSARNTVRLGVPIFKYMVIGCLILAALAGGWILADRSPGHTPGAYLDHWIETLAFKGDSIAVRALLVDCGVRMWREADWYGLGPGEFKVRFLSTLQNMLTGPDGDRYVGRVSRLHSLRANHLHNEYLQILVEWGVLGLVFVELFLVWCLIYAVRGILCCSSARDAWMLAGITSSIWVGLVSSFYDLPFHRPSQTFTLAILLGAAVASFPAYTSKISPPARRFGAMVAAVAFGLTFLMVGCWMIHQSNVRYVSLKQVYIAVQALDRKIPGADLEKAEAEILQAVRRVPGEGDFQFHLARFGQSEGRDQVRQIRRAREVSDLPDLYLMEARAYVDRKSYSEARPLLDFIEEIDPDRPGLHFLKGIVNQETGRPIAAKEDFRNELRWAEVNRNRPNPFLTECHLRLAHLLRTGGQFQQAVTHYERFLELLGETKPTFPEARLSLARMFRDDFFDYDMAEKYFREALDVFQYQGDRSEIRRVQAKLEEIARRRKLHQER